MTLPDTENGLAPRQWASLPDTARTVALEVLLHGPLARSELALRLGLSSASLSRLTKPLLDAGILNEVGDDAAEAEPQGVGRPRRPLDVNAGRERYVGIKLSGSRADAVLTDLRAEILSYDSAPVVDHLPAAVADVLRDLVTSIAGSEGIAAVGVSVGGVVQSSSVVRAAPFLAWRDVDLAGLLTERLGVPVVVSNDLDALTEAEHWFGAGRAMRNFAVLTIGAGVGCGLVIHDRLVTSPDAGLGLLGHFPLDPLGPACAEGHRGCANALLSTDSIAARASLALGRTLSYHEVLDAAMAGEPAADSIVGVAAHSFGILTAAVANIALPQRIVLTGEGIRLLRIAEDRFRIGLAQNRNPAANALDLQIQDDDPRSWARGAAATAIQHVVLAGL